METPFVAHRKTCLKRTVHVSLFLIRMKKCVRRGKISMCAQPLCGFPELMLSCPICDDCERFRVESDVHSCVSCVSFFCVWMKMCSEVCGRECSKTTEHVLFRCMKSSVVS